MEPSATPDEGALDSSQGYGGMRESTQMERQFSDCETQMTRAVSDPWNDWVPGVLSKSQVRQLIDAGFLRGVAVGDDESSFDLTLSAEAFRLVRGPIKPKGATYLNSLQGKGFLEILKPEAENRYLLRKAESYLFRLEQQIAIPAVFRRARVFGQATARSSIGRIDVLARLIVDGMETYEEFTPDGMKESTGELFLEITPISFSVLVEKGTPLSQLRLFLGDPRDSEIRGHVAARTVIRQNRKAPGSEDQEVTEPILSLDLTEALVGGRPAVAFSPRRAPLADAIDLTGNERHAPEDHWDIVPPPNDGFFRIEKGRFYILRSRELLRVPEGIAVYCRASDETIGEMRIHYAGFVHPCFGQNQQDGREGTPLIFEVRGHDFDVNLRDGERMAKLIFYRMSRDPESPPLPAEGTPESPRRKPSAYSNQDLTLSRVFKPWKDPAAP